MQRRGGENTLIESNSARATTGIAQHFLEESVIGTQAEESNAELEIVYFADPLNPDFKDPTPENPIDGAEFLSNLCLPGLDEALGKYYSNPKHFHYPIEAMVKTMVYMRMMGIKHWRHLAATIKTPHIAEKLGFQERVPNRYTLELFPYQRLDIKGLNEIHDYLFRLIVDECRIRGITLGKRLAVDSTPLEALKYDKEAKYNGHYEKFMYKVHEITCLDTGISLVCLATGGTEFDGKFLVPMLNRLHRNGIDFEEVYGDAHYSTTRNWADINSKYGAQCIFNVRKADVRHPEGNIESLMDLYNKHWQNQDFKDDARLDYILRFLYENGHQKSVAHYFRNQWLGQWANNPKAREKYKQRTIVERKHSHFKNSLYFEQNIDIRHLREVKKYVLQFWITELAIALTRLQNGITTGLTDCNRSIFV